MEGGNASVIGGIWDETVDLLARFMAGWMVARSRWMSWVDEVDLFSHRVGGAWLIRGHVKGDHGHAHGSRRSELTDYLGCKPWWDPWNSTGKPLLLVDPNWFLIDQLPSSIHHPLGCCISTHGCSLSKARVLIEKRRGH